MAEPTEDDILGVCGICELDSIGDRALVISALKAKNNNLEAVIGEFFDNPGKFRQQYTWDESAFSTGRDGDANTAGISFNIHPSDDNAILHGVEPGASFTALPPSRPPSRANNRSPLGRMIDWTANGAAGIDALHLKNLGANTVIGAPMSRTQEDEDLQKALAASRAESGVASPQETGIAHADTSLPAFGPANRDDYDQNQWAMVPIHKEPAEPPPSSRKREPGSPAFLRCRKTGYERHRLGTLLTVFHEIPAARNALLSSGIPAATYGHSPAWWKGQPIVPAHIQAARDRGELSWADDTDPDFSEEVHRLMAFLDITDRSYGTADVLADLKIISGGWGSGDYEPTFLRVLKETNGDDKTRPLWTYLKLASMQEIPDSDTDSVDEYGMLDLKVPDGPSEGVTSLYNLWDLLYWIEPGTTDAEDEEPAKMAYITAAPEVLTMRINGAVSSIDIPETFYLDRYIESNKEKAATIQAKICRVHGALAKAKEVENHITKWTSPRDGSEWDRSLLINKVIERDEKEIWRVKARALWRKHEECNASGDPFPYLPHLPAQLDNLIELTEREEAVIKHYEAQIDISKEKLSLIDRRLNRLKAEKTACLELLRRLNAKLTVPSEDIHWNPVHEYSLRGVAASPDIVYICRRAEPDLIDMDGSTAAPLDQWWKLAYVADDADPIKVEKTQIETVLRVALTESEDKKPILVYASEKALAEEPSRLSQPLQLFVRFDNRLFKQELIEESPLERKRGANASPQSPFKRQHRDRANSMDSMASNRASVGDLSDEDRNMTFDQDPFQSGDGSFGTEMQPLIDMTNNSAESAPAESSEPLKSEVYDHTRLPTPPYTTFDAEVDSPTMSRQSLRLANVSLDEQNTGSGSEAQARGPEMQERTTSSFLARSDKRLVDNRASIMDMDMEIPSEFDPHRPDGNS